MCLLFAEEKEWISYRVMVAEIFLEKQRNNRIQEKEVRMMRDSI